MSAGEEATILVVDDLPSCRRPVARLLKKNGFKPLCAADGAEALAMLDSVRPAVILLDLDMPGMDGITFLERLQDDAGRAAVPVIVISGQSSRSPLERARELGARDVLVKAHFGPGELLASIRRCLDA